MSRKGSASNPKTDASFSDTNPTSALLQDMIKEKKAQTQRVPKIRDVSGGSWQALDQRGIQSSPLNAASARERPHVRQPSNVGSKRPAPHKEMGLREMQEHISKIDKQNFDLKLEIFHRRQRNEALEAKIEKTELLEAENEELRAENDDLLLKLEKRDADMDVREAAIEEAVGMICDLEARIEDLEQQDSKVARLDQSNAINSAPADFKHDFPETPPQHRAIPIVQIDSRSSPHRMAQTQAKTVTTSSSRSPLRPTSLNAQTKRSSVALRSLYASGNPSFASLARPSSIFSDEELIEELDRQMLQSPRLSILSESGFSSIYGHTQEKQDSLPPDAQNHEQDQLSAIEETSSTPQRLAQREARINDWVEENKRQERPKTPVRHRARELTHGQFSSIDAALGDVPPLPPHRNPLRKKPSSHISSTGSDKKRNNRAYIEERSPTKSLRKSARAHEKLPSHSGSVFGSRFPPTPDTMSTATIGGNSSMYSIITEKSLADGPRLPINGYSSHTRPQTSDTNSSNQPSNGHAFNDDTGFETSDDEVELTGVESSNIDSKARETGFSSATMTVRDRQRTTRFLEPAAPTRPALTTHTTDVILNGEGFSPKDPLRGKSYPSPTGQSSHLRNILSPSSQRSSDVPSERTVTSPPAVTPPERQKQITIPPSALNKSPKAESNAKLSRNHPSLRFRLPRLPSSTHSSAPTDDAPSSSRSVASRIFRRSNSQSANSPIQAEDTITAQPRHSFSRPRLARPSSLYGQSSPTSSIASKETVPQTPRLAFMLPDDMLTDFDEY